MDHFAGLDVSVKETSVCIVDDTGKIVREVKAASEPEALLAVLTNPAYRFKRIGLEAGPEKKWPHLGEEAGPWRSKRGWGAEYLLRSSVQIYAGRPSARLVTNL